MVRRPCMFKQTDLARALKAATKAGVPVKIEIVDGKMTVIPENCVARDRDERNEWDEEYGPDQTETR
jgi:hypothetical protein